VDDAVKFHIKLGILFVHFSPDSVRRTDVPSDHTSSPVCCHIISYCPGQLKNRSSSVVPCKLFKTRYFFNHLKILFMPRMTVSSWTRSLKPLLSSTAKQKNGNCFALFLCWLSNAEGLSLEFFWRHSVVTLAPFLKLPLFLFSEHRHSFCTFPCVSNCIANQCHILSKQQYFS